MSQRNMDRHRRIKGPLVGGGPYCYGEARQLGWTPPIMPIYFNDYVDVHEEDPSTNFYDTKALIACNTDGTDRKLLMKSIRPFSRPEYICVVGTVDPLSGVGSGMFNLITTRDLNSRLEMEVYLISEDFDLEEVTWGDLPSLSSAVITISTGATGSWQYTGSFECNPSGDPASVTSLGFTDIVNVSTVNLAAHIVPSSFTEVYYGILISVLPSSAYWDDLGIHAQGSFAAEGIKDLTAVSGDKFSFVLGNQFGLVAR